MPRLFLDQEKFRKTVYALRQCKADLKPDPRADESEKYAREQMLLLCDQIAYGYRDEISKIRAEYYAKIAADEAETAEIAAKHEAEAAQ